MFDRISVMASPRCRRRSRSRPEIVVARLGLGGSVDPFRCSGCGTPRRPGDRAPCFCDIPGQRHDLPGAFELLRELLRVTAVCPCEGGDLGAQLVGRDLDLLGPRDAFERQVGLDRADRMVPSSPSAGTRPTLGLEQVVEPQTGPLRALAGVGHAVLGLVVDQRARGCRRRSSRSSRPARGRGPPPSASRPFISPSACAGRRGAGRSCRTPRRSSRSRRPPRAACGPSRP